MIASALDIALDATESALRLLADELLATSRATDPSALATLAETRRMAAGAVDRLVDELLAHGLPVYLVDLARRQHRRLADPSAPLLSGEALTWAGAWAAAGDSMAGTKPSSEMAVAPPDVTDELLAAAPRVELATGAVWVEDDDEDDGWPPIGRRVRRPMLAVDEPPSCLAGAVTTRADVAPVEGLVALAKAGEL